MAYSDYCPSCAVFPKEAFSLPLQENVKAPAQPQWHQRALGTIESLGKRWDDVCPDFTWQSKLDDVCCKIHKLIVDSSLVRYIDEQLKVDSHEPTLVFVEKLIPRALRNLLVLLYNILKLLARTCAHPVKTGIEFLQFLILFAHALTLPKTYTGLGAGFIGASAGQAIVTPGPQVLAGLLIGGTLILLGFIFGAIQAAATAEEGYRLEAILQELEHQIQEIPEAAMTGFFMGLILGGVEQIIDPENPLAQAANALDDLGGLSSSMNVPQDL